MKPGSLQRFLEILVRFHAFDAGNLPALLLVVRLFAQCLASRLRSRPLCHLGLRRTSTARTSFFSTTCVGAVFIRTACLGVCVIVARAVSPLLLLDGGTLKSMIRTLARSLAGCLVGIAAIANSGRLGNKNAPETQLVLDYVLSLASGKQGPHPPKPGKTKKHPGRHI